MIRRAGIALAVVVLGGLATPAAAEDAQKFPTGLTLQVERVVDQDTAFGKVRSKERACEARRKVKLLHREVKWHEKWTVLARPRANSKGKWTYKAKANSNGDRFLTPGYYHVKVGEKRISAGDGGIVCKEKYSSPVFIG